MNWSDLIKEFGSQSALADCLEINRANISLWKAGGIPPAKCIEIEKLTDGRLKAIDLIALRAGDDEIGRAHV